MKINSPKKLSFAKTMGWSFAVASATHSACGDHAMSLDSARRTPGEMLSRDPLWGPVDAAPDDDTIPEVDEPFESIASPSALAPSYQLSRGAGAFLSASTAGLSTANHARMPSALGCRTSRMSSGRMAVPSGVKNAAAHST